MKIHPVAPHFAAKVIAPSLGNVDHVQIPHTQRKALENKIASHPQFNSLPDTVKLTVFPGGDVQQHVQLQNGAMALDGHYAFRPSILVHGLKKDPVSFAIPKTGFLGLFGQPSPDKIAAKVEKLVKKYGVQA